eukprot:7839338-Alexandrium_andersonii.AAC.1
MPAPNGSLQLRQRGSVIRWPRASSTKAGPQSTACGLRAAAKVRTTTNLRDHDTKGVLSSLGENANSISRT